MVGRGRGFAEEAAVGVVRVGNGAGFGIAGGKEARERIVGEGAGAPSGGIGGAALLVDGEKVAQAVVGVVGFVVEAGGIFEDLREAAEAVGDGFARLAGLIGDGGGVARVRGGNVVRGGGGGRRGPLRRARLRPWGHLHRANAK